MSIYNFEGAGAIANRNNLTIAAANTRLLNKLLASLKSGSEPGHFICLGEYMHRL